ncbi:MAG: hypothetical protein WBN07_11135 [Woeseiaceae bacterium]
MIKPLQLPCLLAVLACFSAAASGTDTVLMLAARASSAELEPRDEKRHLVVLPALDAAVVATIECAAGARPVSLTVSISDTYRHFGPELLADSRVLEATLELPASQLAPVSVAEFCVKGEVATDQILELPGIATAQVSLRCQNDDESTSMHFGSLPIPVSLYCRGAGEPDPSSLER